MIWLDGYGFSIERNQYAEKPATFADYRRGETGALLVIESGVYQKQYDITLNVSQFESGLLVASFTKSHSTGVYLDFTDQRGVSWLVASGVDDSTHKYSTGVAFVALSDPKPTDALFGLLSRTWQSPQLRFLVTVSLLANSKELA